MAFRALKKKIYRSENPANDNEFEDKMNGKSIKISEFLQCLYLLEIYNKRTTKLPNSPK